MKNTMQDILRGYYDGLSRKDGWQAFISDGMRFNGTGVAPTQGRQAYIDSTDQFLRMVKAAKVKEMIVEGGRACVLVQYDLTSPKGNSTSSDIVELLTVKDGKIDSSTIFFDTAAFAEFVSQ